MKFAVLGGCGSVGRRLVVRARHLGHTVTAAGRDHARLAPFRADHHVQLAMGDTNGLQALVQTHDVLVNATGVEGWPPSSRTDRS